MEQKHEHFIILAISFFFQNPDCGEVAQISYNEKNQILAAGFSNNTVKTWAGTLGQ